MRLSDSIETFIKTLLAEDEPEVELKRNELAEYFGCAPSQIIRCKGTQQISRNFRRGKIKLDERRIYKKYVT